MWFGLSLLFKSEHVPKAEDSVWEEVFIVLEADTESEAREKAWSYGIEQEVDYKAANGDFVSWRLKHICRVAEVENAFNASGTEVFSRFLKDSEIESFKTAFD